MNELSLLRTLENEATRNVRLHLGVKAIGVEPQEHLFFLLSNWHVDEFSTLVVHDGKNYFGNVNSGIRKNGYVTYESYEVRESEFVWITVKDSNYKEAG